MFQFPACASPRKGGMPDIRSGGLPHSETPGSMATCAYPGRIAACRVLRRPREPRHPPRALVRSSGAGTGGFPPPGADRDGAQKAPPLPLLFGRPGFPPGRPASRSCPTCQRPSVLPRPGGRGDKSRAPGCRSPRAPTGRPAYMKEARKAKRRRGGSPAPERRCSSRTFRYGYLVTT